MVDGVNQQPGLFQRIGNFFGADDPNAGQPTDPFAGLSRPQRTMLGFAALRDAAASLEGRDSNFFQSALGGFEQARERERLRTQGMEANRNQQIQNAIQAAALARATGDAGLMALADAQLQALGSAVTPTQAITLAAGGAMPSPATVPTTAAPATRPATGRAVMDATGAVVGDIADEPLSPTAQAAMAGTPAPAASVAPTTAVSSNVADLDRQIADIEAQIENLISATPDMGQTAAASFAGLSLDDPQAQLRLDRLQAQEADLIAQRNAEIQKAEVAAQEAAAAQARAETRTPQTVNTLQTVNDLQRDIQESPRLTTGFWGSVLGNVPGSAAYDARALATTIKANLGFDQLQAMREASPTGGALGQVAVQELEALQSTIGNLDLAQSKEQVLDNLTAIEDNYKRLIRRAYETSEDVSALDRALGGRPAFMVEGNAGRSGGDIPQITSDADYDALPSGAQFIAPDGTIRRKP